MGVFWMSYAAVLLMGVITTEQTARLLTGMERHVSPTLLVELPRLPMENGRVDLIGPIDFDMFEGLKVMTEQQIVRSIALHSDGGSIHAARGLVRLIREAKLPTRAEGPCRSACALVFLAGSERSLGPNGSLGFHAYASGQSSGAGKLVLGDPLAELKKDLEWVRSIGISEEFTRRILRVPHSDMWHPSRAELQAAGILTR
jgi:hypothetical protein